MEKEKKFGKMETYMKETGSMILEKEKVFSRGLTVIHMMACGKII